MTSADVFEQIEKMGELPSLPQTLLRVQSVAADESSSATDLAQCILQDQALTLRVLKVVNSAMYQRRETSKINTVRKAVIVMGFETVRKLALGLSVFDMMSKLSRSPWLAHIANHSLMTAAYARILARAVGLEDQEGAFVAALVHDIGKVVLLECSPAAMDRVVADQAEGMPGLAAERVHYGITHDRAGRRLAKRWQLPEAIQNIIGDHHDIDPMNPPRSLDPLLGVIVYADAMSAFRGAPEDHDFEYRILCRAGRALGIPHSRLDDVYEQVLAAAADLAECFGVDIGDLHEYGMLVNTTGSATVAPQRLTPEEIARRTAEQLELYQSIGRGLAGAEEGPDMLRRILRGAVDILGFERVVLLDVDRENHRFRARAVAGIEVEALAPRLELPIKRSTGALALSVLEHRAYHVPDARNDAYGELAGADMLDAAHCTGFAVCPVMNGNGLVAVIYADCGPDGDDVLAEQANELAGLAVQAGLVLSLPEAAPVG